MYALAVRGAVIGHVRFMASFSRPGASRRQPKRTVRGLLAIAAAAMSSTLSAEDEDVCGAIGNVQSGLYKSIN
jgi:hypothetical protein